MKRWNKLAMLLALALAGSAFARAEDSPEKSKGDAQEHVKMFEHMKKNLGLSDETAGKLKDLFESQRKASEPLHQQMKVTFEKLRWQVDAKADSADIAATLDEAEKGEKALQEQHEKLKAAVNALLTPEQRAKMLLAHGPGGPAGPEGMRGRPNDEKWKGRKEGKGPKKGRGDDDDDDKPGPKDGKDKE